MGGGGQLDTDGNVEGPWICSQKIWVPALTLSVINEVTLGNLLNLSEPQFLPLQNGDTNSTQALWRSHERVRILYILGSAKENPS